MSQQAPAAGGDPGQDEELPEPRRHRATRLRVDLAIGASLLVVALLVVNAISHGDHKSSRPRATATTSAVLPPVVPAHPEASPFVTLTRVPGGFVPRDPLPARTSRDARACPVGQMCAELHDIPAAVAAAVRSQFPGAQVISVDTVRLAEPSWTRRVWFREITAHVGLGRLRLSVQVPLRDGRQPLGPLSGTVVYAVSQQYSVVVALDPQTEGELYTMLRLAQDPRLLDAR